MAHAGARPTDYTLEQIAAMEIVDKIDSLPDVIAKEINIDNYFMHFVRTGDHYHLGCGCQYSFNDFVFDDKKQAIDFFELCLRGLK